MRCLARNVDKARSLLGDKPEFCQGNITDLHSLKLACQGVETVIHLVAIIREKDQLTFDLINVQGTRNIVSAAERIELDYLSPLSPLE